MDSRVTRRRSRRYLSLFLAWGLVALAGGVRAAGSTPPPAAATTVTAAATVTTTAPAPALKAAAPAGMEAFDWAFRFASAIHSDPKDMARAQGNVVDDLAEAGHLDEAIRRAEQIEGWRRGTAFADLAARLAERVRQEEARALLDRVDKIRAGSDGWEGPRVEAHVAQALATMGDPGRAAEIGGKLAADDRQYQGRSAATTATGLARQGNFAAAMSVLAPLDDNDDIDVAWWRTAGYLAIAKQERLPADKRREALDAARASAEKVPDWRKMESLQSVAEEYRRIGAPAEARACLKTAEEGLVSLPTTMAIRSPLISNLARAWAKAGDKERARGLLTGAAAHVDDAMLTERPAIWANLASSYAAVGDEALAWQTFDRALTAAAVLENARPRALGVVSVCRQIGRARLNPPATMQTRLEGLYKGLKDPW